MLSQKTIDSHMARLERLCDALPEVEARHAQHHTFLVRNRKFAYYLVDHHGDGRVSMEFKSR